MSTLLVDPVTGDLAITAGRITVTSDPATEYRQKMVARLNAVLGEWRYSAGEGLPYFERIFVKNPTLSEIQGIFRKAILSVPGTVTVTFANFVFDTVNRGLSFSFTTTTDFTSTPITFNFAFDSYRALTSS